MAGDLLIELVEQGVVANHSLNSDFVLRLTPPAVLNRAETDFLYEAFDRACRLRAPPTRTRRKAIHPMRSAHVTLGVPDADTGTAFKRVRDFARYPELVDVVRSVTVRGGGDSAEISDWEVYFRNGVLRWTESDLIDPAALTISFAQVDGDFESFSGTWAVVPDGAGCRISFDTEFDFGIPSLAGILDPVAERVFKETIARVVRGLFPSAEVIGDPSVARALEQSLAQAAPGAGRN